MGITHFDADVVIEEDKKKQNISFGYDGVYIDIYSLL
jgi:hypothetical protein